MTDEAKKAAALARAEKRAEKARRTYVGTELYQLIAGPVAEGKKTLPEIAEALEWNVPDLRRSLNALPNDDLQRLLADGLVR